MYFLSAPWQYCHNYGLGLPTTSVITGINAEPRRASARSGEATLVQQYIKPMPVFIRKQDEW